jgi:hypothetical protein
MSVRSGRLRGAIVPVPRLSGADVDGMWGLFDRYYADVERSRFEADLAQKQKVILLRDSGDRSIQGFSTIQILEGEVEGKPYRALYSGDTVCDRAYWGQKALQRQFLWVLISEKLRRPSVPLYWFLISKGYKTYLLLARNYPDCWPRRGVVTPGHVAQILDQLATRKFGAAWKRELGIVRFDTPLGRLKEQVAPIEERLLEDPDIRFFAEHNPGHVHGEELCCLAAVDFHLLRVAMRKFLLRRSAARVSPSA